MFVSASVLLVATSLSVNWLLLIGLVVVGMLAIAFTPYRYVLGYFVLGMVYWIFVEGLYWLVTHLTSLTDINAYVAAIGISMVPMVIALNWQPLAKRKSKARIAKDEIQRSAGQRPISLEKDTDFHQNFVRHTSVYESKH